VKTRQLSRSIFYPQPHVDSTLIVLERLGEEHVPTVDPLLLREVVQAAFGQRRKTLVNALTAGLRLPRQETMELVASLGLTADVRAERLKPAEFVRLAERLKT
jgi:16S rRNA (adenine1518-N6/adenine1519-N6)-dimethyltransferase